IHDFSGQRGQLHAAAPVLRRLTKRFIRKQRTELADLLSRVLDPSPGGTPPAGFRESRRLTKVTSVRCPACQQVMHTTHRFEHLQKTCPARFAMCPSCKRSVPIENIPDHRTLGCPTACDACKAIVRQPDLQKHVTQDCPALTRLCPHCHRRVPSSQ